MKKFVSLLSGGLDSPVAAYLMIKRGFSPIFLSFLTSDDKNTTMKKKIVQIVGKLSQNLNSEVKLYLFNHDPNLDVFKECCERKLTCVLCKRLMIRTASMIGKRENTNIIVTGDILGEQASQTISNLFAYNTLVRDFIILRPLIGCDKLNVIKLNEKIGLYDICSQYSAGCEYNPQYPETNAKIREVDNAESVIDYEDLLNTSLENAEILIF